MNATVRDGVLKGGHCYDYAKRQQKPQSGRQLVGTVGLVDGCGSDRDRPRIAIRLVTRARGPLFGGLFCPGYGRSGMPRLCARPAMADLMPLIFAVINLAGGPQAVKSEGVAEQTSREELEGCTVSSHVQLGGVLPHRESRA